MMNSKNVGLSGMSGMDMGLGDRTQSQLADEEAARKKKGIQPDALSSSGMMMLLGNASPLPGQ
jgi:hypothetical protein